MQKNRKTVMKIQILRSEIKTISSETQELFWLWEEFFWRKSWSVIRSFIKLILIIIRTKLVHFYSRWKSTFLEKLWIMMIIVWLEKSQSKLDTKICSWEWSKFPKNNTKKSDSLRKLRDWLYLMMLMLPHFMSIFFFRIIYVWLWKSVMEKHWSNLFWNNQIHLKKRLSYTFFCK
jgi:hypothetical protein